MDIFDPGTEVWICPCGAPRMEPGLCPDCERDSVPPTNISAIKIFAVIILVFILACVAAACGMAIYVSHELSATLSYILGHSK